MDIQHGDRVYYQGEVWTVDKIINPNTLNCWYELTRPGGVNVTYITQAQPEDVQRVEQVR